MSAACLTSFGHAEAVALLMRGYHPMLMAEKPDPEDTQTLRIVQDDRAADEDRHAREAEAPDAAKAHRRRAEKAAYLRDKLAEADRSSRKR
jgi:hypothetical protein